MSNGMTYVLKKARNEDIWNFGLFPWGNLTFQFSALPETNITGWGKPHNVILLAGAATCINDLPIHFAQTQTQKLTDAHTGSKNTQSHSKELLKMILKWHLKPSPIIPRISYRANFYLWTCGWNSQEQPFQWNYLCVVFFIVLLYKVAFRTVNESLVTDLSCASEPYLSFHSQHRIGY